MSKISDSILFITSVRQALKHSIGVSETADKKYVKNMQNFIMNEATDYQVMSLIVSGSLPKEKRNIKEETKLFNIYKNSIKEDYKSYVKLFGADITKSLVSEIGPVSPLGIDTAAPILTHLYESGALALLSELKPKSNKDIYKQGTEMVKKTKGSPAALDKSVRRMGRSMQIKGAKGMVKDTAAGAYQQLKTGAQAMKDVPASAKTLGAKETAKAAGQAAGQMVKGGGKILAPIAAAAGAIYAGAKAYQNFMSKAARACKGSEDKSACMKGFKQKAIKHQISTIQAGYTKCNAAKNPEKCKATIAKKVGKLKGKLAV